jgi:hypothetical protein
VYYAYQYKPNGVGKSLLDGLDTLISMRAMLLFSSINGTIKNSLTRTKAVITLDEKDPEPKKTMHSALNALLKSRMDDMPVGEMDVSNLSEWIHKAGFQAIFKHPDLPDMDVEILESGGDRVMPDTTLMDNIKNDITRSFGIPPEILIDADSANFAVNIKALQGILADNIREYQLEFNKHFTKHVQLLCRNDGNLKKELEDIVKSNYSAIYKKLPKITKEEISNFSGSKDRIIEDLVEEVIDDIEIHLPEATSQEPDATKDNFDNHMEKLDDVIELFISTDSLPDEFSSLESVDIDTLKELFKATLGRKWVNDNNYVPDLTQAFELNNAGEPVVDILNDFNTFEGNLHRLIKPFIKQVAKTKAKREDVPKKTEDDNPDDKNAPSDKEVADELNN